MYFPFSLFLSPSSVFFYIFPVSLFLFSYFSPQMTSKIFFPSPGGGGYFSIYRPLGGRIWFSECQVNTCIFVRCTYRPKCKTISSTMYVTMLEAPKEKWRYLIHRFFTAIRTQERLLVLMLTLPLSMSKVHQEQLSEFSYNVNFPTFWLFGNKNINQSINGKNLSFPVLVYSIFWHPTVARRTLHHSLHYALNKLIK